MSAELSSKISNIRSLLLSIINKENLYKNISLRQKRLSSYIVDNEDNLINKEILFIFNNSYEEISDNLDKLLIKIEETIEFEKENYDKYNNRIIHNKYAKLNCDISFSTTKSKINFKQGTIVTFSYYNKTSNLYIFNFIRNFQTYSYPLRKTQFEWIS